MTHEEFVTRAHEIAASFGYIQPTYDVCASSKSWLGRTGYDVCIVEFERPMACHVVYIADGKDAEALLERVATELGAKTEAA